jgi:release factor glutamine methyltransferase
VALDGGTDGLNIIRRLLAQAPDYLRPDGAMFLEIGPSHPDQVTALLQRHLPDASIQVSFDLEGSPRVISAEREPKSTFSAARPS